MMSPNEGVGGIKAFNAGERRTCPVPPLLMGIVSTVNVMGPGDVGVIGEAPTVIKPSVEVIPTDVIVGTFGIR